MRVKKPERSDTADESRIPAADGATRQTPVVRRTTEDSRRRPVLKAKPVGSRTDDEAPKATVRAGTLYSADGSAADETPAQQAPNDASDERAMLNTIVVPPPGEQDPRYLYATHRSPPPDETAVSRKPAVAAGARGEKQVSAGFLLGVALIIIALLSGVFIVRLNKRVAALETRINAFDQTGPPVVADALDFQ